VAEAGLAQLLLLHLLQLLPERQLLEHLAFLGECLSLHPSPATHGNLHTPSGSNFFRGRNCTFFSPAGFLSALMAIARAPRFAEFPRLTELPRSLDFRVDPLMATCWRRLSGG
jgi:hypothetical protein